MLVAILADIHGNLEALLACLAHAQDRGADQLVFLGDLIGYGADPEAVLDLTMAEVSKGALALLGNHDAAVRTRNGGGRMNDVATAAIQWTRPRLNDGHRRFLDSLPMTLEEEGVLFVHADASAPERWRYVTDAETARRSMAATEAHATFCGHTHRPALFSEGATGKLTTFRPVAGAPVPLARGRKWLGVAGAVGQPRDGDPAACYLTYDTERLEAAWNRVPYDTEAAAAKIRAAGLPGMLAERLLIGR